MNCVDVREITVNQFVVLIYWGLDNRSAM